MPKCQGVAHGQSGPEGQHLYSVARSGGVGSVFKAAIEGGKFAGVYMFKHNADKHDGGGPTLGLVRSGQSFYGTTNFGGTQGYGTIYKITQ